MRKALALAAFLAMAPYAQAQEGASTFSPNAEFRVRYQFDNNVAADKDTEPTSQNAVEHRMKFGGTFKASDKLSMTFQGLHAATWGNDVNTNNPPQNGLATAVGDKQNMLLIQEAYATWMLSDEFTLKVGRGALTLADGSVISVNDWEQDPYTFEGVLGTYEMEAGRISAWFVRFAELAGVGAATDQDPEANSVALAYSHKILPEFLKAADIHVMKNTKSALGNTDATAGKDDLRYGVHLAGDVNMIDFKANYAAHTGDKTYVGLANNKREGNMWELEVGANFEEFMNSRVYVMYHQDSGKNAGSTTQKDQLYDSFYYEKHENAGLMDIFAWGNLTDMAVGYTVQPADATTVGLHYHMFKKTEKASGYNTGLHGSKITANDTTKDDLGSEIDLVATHAYDNGMMITGRLGMFMPGDALKPTHNDTYTAAFLEAKMNF